MKIVETERFGFNTDRNTRPILFENLRYIINNEPNIIIDPELFNEIRTLERKKGGKIEHGDNFHDDVLMAFLIGYTILTEGRNINRFLKVISDNPNNNDNLDKVKKAAEILKLYNKDNMDRIINNHDLSSQLIENFNNRNLNDFENSNQQDINKSNFENNQQLRKQQKIRSIMAFNKRK